MVKQKLTFAQNIYGEGRSALKIAKVIKYYIEGGLNGQ
jgi:UDP-N-acetylglucosamine 2-epimerase